ncbi:MAG: hypothetical protein ACYDCK_06505 [Thermoplasmatota archaeon]
MSAKGKPEEKEIHLTLGSKYRVLSLASRDATVETRGIFKGITTVGTIDAVCIEVEAGAKDHAGKLRVIPTHVIVCLDIIEAVADKETETRAEQDLHYT